MCYLIVITNVATGEHRKEMNKSAIDFAMVNQNTECTVYTPCIATVYKKKCQFVAILNKDKEYYDLLDAQRAKHS